MNIFIDTNILIDYVCRREGFYEEAKRLFALAITHQITISFTDISVINSLYVGKKYGYTAEELSELLQKLLHFCNVSTINSNILLKALSSSWQDKEDATQYFSAADNNDSIIVTRNKKDFLLSEIEVCTPYEFLQKFKYNF